MDLAAGALLLSCWWETNVTVSQKEKCRRKKAAHLHESLVATSWKRRRKIVSMWRRLSTTSCARYDAKNNNCTALRIGEEHTHQTEGNIHGCHETTEAMDETSGQDERKEKRDHAPSCKIAPEFVVSPGGIASFNVSRRGVLAAGPALTLPTSSRRNPYPPPLALEGAIQNTQRRRSSAMAYSPYPYS
jgi:hypothetical protein